MLPVANQLAFASMPGIDIAARPGASPASSYRQLDRKNRGSSSGNGLKLSCRENA